MRIENISSMIRKKNMPGYFSEGNLHLIIGSVSETREMLNGREAPDGVTAEIEIEQEETG